MNADQMNYEIDMQNMPTPSDEEISEMLNEMYRLEVDRLEEDWELEQEYKFRGMWVE